MYSVPLTPFLFFPAFRFGTLKSMPLALSKRRAKNFGSSFSVCACLPTFNSNSLASQHNKKMHSNSIASQHYNIAASQQTIINSIDDFQFDGNGLNRSTKDPEQQPFEYQAGVGELITGWDKVCRKRTLVCSERRWLTFLPDCLNFARCPNGHLTRTDVYASSLILS
jgi:hypothetical protein